VPHLKVAGKGGKTRYLPLHPGTHGLINDYLDVAGHGLDESGALFRPVRNDRTGRMEDAITADGVYRLVRRYSGQLGRPPPQMRSIIRPISPRCRNGSVTPISRPPASTITGARGLKTARRSRSFTDDVPCPS
jgi:hypothetical protein